MPELPEVEHVCRYLRSALAGRRIRTLAHFDWPRALRGVASAGALGRGVAGRRVERVERRAKIVLVGLEGGGTLAFHLKMTGKLWVTGPPRPPGRETRAIFSLDGGRSELRFEDQRKFGWVALLGPAARERLLAPFGPDAFEGSEAAIAAAYAARRGRAKPVLLDQTVVAGIGNIYADEILHAARVHPTARLQALAPAAIRRLARATRAVMAEALARREGEEVPDQRRVGSGARGVAARLGPRVYQRTGEPCLRCRTPIERIVLAGRATHFCPRCQAPSA